MRTPRRVPWSTQAELSELYEWLFSPSADGQSRRRGLGRMNVYLSSPSCPAFIHLLHTLVSADLLPPPADSAATHSTRLTCAMAVVRFINGMVDPLQTGPYARPISRLAASIQIPPSLISLRHRATHEDLPPLPLLRQSVLQAINYLHTYSFLPLLASSSAQTVYDGRDRAEKLVGRWKRSMKDRLRDREVAEDTDRAKELRRVKRGLEVEEVEDVVEALCGSEGMVPLARKKRPGYNDTTPSSALRQVWTPLLAHLTAFRPAYPAILADHIMSVLTDEERRSQLFQAENSQTQEKEKEQKSSRWTLAVWLLYIWSGGVEQEGIILSGEDKRGLWARLVNAQLSGDPILRRLAGTLAEHDISLQSSWADIENLLPDEGEILSGLDDLPAPVTDKAEDRLAQMEERLRMLQGIILPAAASETLATPMTDAVGTAPGWNKLGRDWRACPIGVWGVA